MQMQALSFSHRPAPPKLMLPPPSPTAISAAFKLRLRPFQCSASLSPSLVVDEKRFLEASENGNVIPLYKCIFSDHLTPVLAYRCLVKEDDREAPSFLFESVEPGFRASSVGRYSVVGSHPSVEIVAKENKVTIVDHESGKIIEELMADPMTIPKSISEGWKPQLIQDLPDAFCGCLLIQESWIKTFDTDAEHKARGKLGLIKVSGAIWNKWPIAKAGKFRHESK